MIIIITLSREILKFFLKLSDDSSICIINSLIHQYLCFFNSILSSIYVDTKKPKAESVYLHKLKERAKKYQR